MATIRLRRRASVLTALVYALCCSLIATGALAVSGPRCPSAGGAVAPAYGAIDQPPAVEVWHDIIPDPSGGCLENTRDRVPLVVAVAGRFRHAKSIGDIARRIGAVSATRGIKYWSTTDSEWRHLVSYAVALKGPDTKSVRPDFTAPEILSGRPLYFAQDDTRSSGLNLYRLTARAASRDRLVVEIVNLSPIRLWLVTLFGPESLVSVHFIDRLAPGIWGYYGLTAVFDGAREGSEKSFINRAAVYHRFIIGVPADRNPPLAP